jgi:outer membrane protein assembly complex protein YaeT
MRGPRLLLPLAIALGAVSVARAEVSHVASATVAGRTLEPKDRLLGFLGLAPGTPVDDVAALEDRVDEALQALGYFKKAASFTPSPDGLVVALTVEPMRLVRHVLVHGNWPVFDDEVKRRLTLRPGSRLPAEAELPALLAREAQRVKDFLIRDGYFDGDVDVVVKADGRPEWVNLDVLVHLGHWYRLTAVAVSGATVLSANDFLGFFGSHRPSWLGRLRLEALRDDAHDAEKEYRDRGYPAARVLPEFDPAHDLDRREGRATLRVKVTEKARVEVRFVGNRSLTEKQLRERVTIFSSGSYDEVEIAESVKELARLYQSSGFLEARVSSARRRSADSAGPSPETKGGSSPVEEITFIIEEGPQLKVRAIDFAPEPGAAPLTAEDKVLRGLIATRVFPRLGVIGLGEGGFVTRVQLEQDEEKIKAFERGRGYPEPRVRGELVRDPEAFGRVGVLAADVAAERGRGSDLYVRFYIDEGRRETVEAVQVDFHGAHTLDEKRVAELLALPPGAAYSADALKAAKARVADFYGTRGHPYVEIDPSRSSWNPEHTRVRIVLSVDEGPEVRFGEILIRGNFKTADWVIRRDLPFKTGDLFDRDKLALAERNLQTHTIFNGVRVVPLGLSSGKVNPVPILVEIQQERYDDWGTPQLSLGYSTDVGLSISPAYFWGNVFGGGGQAELRGEAAFDLTQTPSANVHAPFYRRLSLSLRYVHPHLFIPSLRVEAAGFIRNEQTVRLGEVESAGASASLSWVYSPSFRVFGRYQWTLATLQSIDFQHLPGYGDSSTAVPDQTRTGQLTVGAVFDDRTSFDGAKNPLMPTSGWLVAASLSAASTWLLGGDNFLVASGQVQRYQPLDDKARNGRGVSMIFNLRCDWGIPLGGATSLPAVDRFFAGGDVATRGFETDMLKTNIIRSDVSPAPAGAAYRIVPQGGNIRMLGTVELQFPITTVAGFPWMGALFFDAGTIFASPSSFRFTRDARDCGVEHIDSRVCTGDVKASVGLTLARMLTPVGPISLEYAYPITQTLAEEQWRSAPWYRHWPGLIHFNWGIPILR